MSQSIFILKWWIGLTIDGTKTQAKEDDIQRTCKVSKMTEYIVYHVGLIIIHDKIIILNTFLNVTRIYISLLIWITSTYILLIRVSGQDWKIIFYVP